MSKLRDAVEVEDALREAIADARLATSRALREGRVHAGYGLREAARLLDVDAPYLRRMEQGKAPVMRRLVAPASTLYARRKEELEAAQRAVVSDSLRVAGRKAERILALRSHE